MAGAFSGSGTAARAPTPARPEVRGPPPQTPGAKAAKGRKGKPQGAPVIPRPEVPPARPKTKPAAVLNPSSGQEQRLAVVRTVHTAREAAKVVDRRADALVDEAVENTILTALMGKDVGDRSTWKTLLRSGQLDNQKIEIDVRCSLHTAVRRSPRPVHCLLRGPGLTAPPHRQFR